MVGFRTLTDRLRRSSSWFPSFLVVVLLMTASAIITFQSDADATVELLPPTASPADREAMLQYLRSEEWRMILIIPFRLLGSLALGSVVLMASCRAFLHPKGIRYPNYLSLLTRAEIILAVRALCVALIVGVTHSDPLIMRILGGAQVGGVGATAMQILWESASLFSFSYVLFLCLGLHLLCRTGWFGASVLAAGYWSGSVLLNRALVQLLSGQYHFPV